MNKTPEELKATHQRITAALIRNLKEGVARDKPITDKIIEELDRKLTLAQIDKGGEFSLQ